MIGQYPVIVMHFICNHTHIFNYTHIRYTFKQDNKSIEITVNVDGSQMLNIYKIFVCTKCVSTN